MGSRYLGTILPGFATYFLISCSTLGASGVALLFNLMGENQLEKNWETSWSRNNCGKKLLYRSTWYDDSEERRRGAGLKKAGRESSGSKTLYSTRKKGRRNECSSPLMWIDPTWGERYLRQRTNQKQTAKVFCFTKQERAGGFKKNVSPWDQNIWGRYSRDLRRTFSFLVQPWAFPELLALFVFVPP